LFDAILVRLEAMDFRIAPEARGGKVAANHPTEILCGLFGVKPLCLAPQQRKTLLG
jgi:hypothetical protein